MTFTGSDGRTKTTFDDRTPPITATIFKQMLRYLHVYTIADMRNDLQEACEGQWRLGGPPAGVHKMAQWLSEHMEIEWSLFDVWPPYKRSGHQLRERLAAVQHDIWSYWMEYLFSVSIYNEDGTVTIPAEKVTRWTEQLKTDYAFLSDEEQKSDRHQADKVITTLEELTGEKRPGED